MRKWDDDRRIDNLCQKAVDFIEDVIDGKLTDEEFRHANERLRAAGYVIDRKAWPQANNRQVVVNIAVLHKDALEAAKAKAGLLNPITVSVDRQLKVGQENNEKKDKLLK